MTKVWQRVKIIGIDYWHTNLATFHLNYFPEMLKPGQYMNFGIINTEGKRIIKSYTIISLQHESTSFLAIRISQNSFTSALFQRSVGDTIEIMPKCMGDFHLDRIVDAEILWLLATGTGVAPYIAILKSLKVWQKFQKVILLHSVQDVKELVYYEALKSLANMKPLRYVPIISQNKIKQGFTGSLIDLLQADNFYQYTHCHLNADRQQMMLCAHLQVMIKVNNILKPQGWRLNQNSDGQITQGRDWSTDIYST
jgi:ferredoxin/flavodoxin---NADP+ reductase